MFTMWQQVDTDNESSWRPPRGKHQAPLGELGGGVLGVMVVRLQGEPFKVK